MSKKLGIRSGRDVLAEARERATRHHALVHAWPVLALRAEQPIHPSGLKAEVHAPTCVVERVIHERSIATGAMVELQMFKAQETLDRVRRVVSERLTQLTAVPPKTARRKAVRSVSKQGAT